MVCLFSTYLRWFKNQVCVFVAYKNMWKAKRNWPDAVTRIFRLFVLLFLGLRDTKTISTIQHFWKDSLVFQWFYDGSTDNWPDLVANDYDFSNKITLRNLVASQYICGLLYQLWGTSKKHWQFPGFSLCLE